MFINSFTHSWRLKAVKREIEYRVSVSTERGNLDCRNRNPLVHFQNNMQSEAFTTETK